MSFYVLEQRRRGGLGDTYIPLHLTPEMMQQSIVMDFMQRSRTAAAAEASAAAAAAGDPAASSLPSVSGWGVGPGAIIAMLAGAAVGLVAAKMLTRRA